VTASDAELTAVRENEARLAGIIASAMVAVISTDESRRIVLFNRAAEVMFGVLDEFIPARFRESHARHMREFAGTGVTARNMARDRGPLLALRADGSEFPVEATISQSEVGGRKMLTAILRDVSARMATEAALHASEQRFRATFEQAAVGIAHVALDGRWLLVNDRLLEIVGFERDELLARTFQDITHPDDLAADLEQVKRLLTGELQTYGMEKRYLRSDRSFVWVNLTVSLVRHDDGSPAYFISVVEDISRRHRAEEELRVANDALVRANEELAVTTYAMAHDLRSPLRAIDAYSHIIADEYSAQLDTRARRQFERIRSNAQRMGQLIDGLLALARLSRGDLNPVRLNLSAIARRILNELIAVEHDRRFETRVVEGLVVMADARFVRIVLENLLANAVKFTRGRDPAVIEVGSTMVDDEVAYYVRDNGIGFSSEHATQLFRPFHRLHEGDEYEGTGIGLATVRRVIERHGGRVWAEAKPATGATFFFTLTPKDGQNRGRHD
jgi:PAS domain S-box-containing protein